MKDNHPIEGLMTTAMQSIKDMVDVNTIVGDAVQAPDGTVIIPISRVCFGFAAGGGDYAFNRDKDERLKLSEESEKQNPFAGGSGAGVSINPVAFMIVGNNNIKLLPVEVNSSLEKIIDLVPELIEHFNGSIGRKVELRKEGKVKDGATKIIIEE
jgi:sporulation protein YtfJ